MSVHCSSRQTPDHAHVEFCAHSSYTIRSEHLFCVLIAAPTDNDSSGRVTTEMTFGSQAHDWLFNVATDAAVTEFLHAVTFVKLHITRVLSHRFFLSMVV